MIHIASAREISFLEHFGVEAIEKNGKKLNEKIFTVKDSSLSYRQVNSLGAEDMLLDRRNNKKGWRKFSFKDLVYLTTIDTCRKYGLQNMQLQELKDSFYHNDNSEELVAVDFMLLYVLAGTKISLMINHDGSCYFVDMNLQSLVDDTHNSYLYINFNEIVKQIWDMIYKKSNKNFPKYKDWSDLFIEHITSERVEGKEKELLDIIRKKEYTKITIKKKGKDSYHVYGENQKARDGITQIELLEKLKKRDFTNIKVTKRDGKIVNYKQEDVFKL